MASRLKRISERSEHAIAELARAENRTFVAQLDIVVEHGLTTMGRLDVLPDPPQTPAEQPS